MEHDTDSLKRKRVVEKYDVGCSMRSLHTDEERYFRLWCDLDPARAYIAGVQLFHGRLLNNGNENIAALVQRIDVLLGRCPTNVGRILRAHRFHLLYEEPADAPNRLGEMLFKYLLKQQGRLHPADLEALLVQAATVLHNSRVRLQRSGGWTIPLCLLALFALNGVYSMCTSEPLKQTIETYGLMSRWSVLVKEMDAYAQVFVPADHNLRTRKMWPSYQSKIDDSFKLARLVLNSRHSTAALLGMADSVAVCMAKSCKHVMACGRRCTN